MILLCVPFKFYEGFKYLIRIGEDHLLTEKEKLSLFYSEHSFKLSFIKLFFWARQCAWYPGAVSK